MSLSNTNELLFTPSGVGGSLFAEIIIPLALPQNYTWSIPEHFMTSVQIGSRVEVQLRNKKQLELKPRSFKTPDFFFDFNFLQAPEQQQHEHTHKQKINRKWKPGPGLKSQDNVWRVCLESFRI